MEYTVVLKDNREKAYKTFVWFLFFLHIVAAAFFALNTIDKNIRLGIYIVLGFYVLISGLYFILRKRKKAFETFSLTMALFYANFWLKHVGAIALFIFGAIFLFADVMQRRKSRLLFSEKGIKVTKALKTVFHDWYEMQYLILKDRILTVDLKSNKIIQAEITEEAFVLNEKEFNSFCISQLEQTA